MASDCRLPIQAAVNHSYTRNSSCATRLPAIHGMSEVKTHFVGSETQCPAASGIRGQRIDPSITAMKLSLTARIEAIALRACVLNSVNPTRIHGRVFAGEG